ncbi:NAD-dependent epimerase/dehydratase family protein [Asticcacaulis sp.]|uniref:NAD-dependent epimerase/dehydratase family protein n=1 Tax=Asticcacaulis sp. TaxID=1872648 RepID=UPI002BB0EB64|nr:NAD-dependent epimerase/dehydratase family protein [Asticcacaulis sp.]HTM81226.1 NAD-dependent epimerase/dehydratase family protein [Asticcacaulis sp.]
MPKILIIGANGQLGSELAIALADKYGAAQIVTSDISPAQPSGLRHEILDATDADALRRVVTENAISQVYHLAAALSATGEKNPLWAWNLNMTSLLNVLELARERKLSVFWPSSIAVFGSTTPADHTPQKTIIEPETVYGISKQAGEGWCRWYNETHGVDVRSLRYPGLISWKTPPGGGTTDYAIDIFRAAVLGETYSCFLDAHETLPMMYMADAIRATIELMEAPADTITERGSYNVSGVSFSPAEIAAEIARQSPGFHIEYAPDYRQAIAAAWPDSLDDSQAATDWGWRAEYGLPQLVSEMLAGMKRHAPVTLHQMAK